MVFWNRNATRADKMDKLAELLMDESKNAKGLRKKINRVEAKFETLEDLQRQVEELEKRTKELKSV